ncbi:ATP-binding cassette domain-containing protein [Microbacterium sp. A588]
MNPWAIEADAITKTYPRGIRAVDGVTLRVRPGEVYGLVGPNGAGKTTLLRMLTGLVSPTSGSFRVHGSTLGSLIEGPAFYPSMSGHSNLTLLCEYWGMPRSDADHALDRVGLNTSDRHRPYRQYSLGMKQRLGVAATLLGDPRIVVLDEPTNGLDPESIVGMREIVQELRADGCAVMLSSHLLSEVELVADRVGVLAEGRLIAEGDVDDLRRRLSGGRWVKVEVDSPDRAVAVAEELGLTSSEETAMRIQVRLDDRVEPHLLNKALVAAGVEVSALVEVRESLETAFLGLISEPTRGELAEQAGPDARIQTQTQSARSRS